MFTGILTVDSHTRKKDTEFISDGNSSSCVSVPPWSQKHILAELTMQLLSESVTNNQAVIQVKTMVIYCDKLTFLINSGTNSTCGRTNGQTGQLLNSTAIPGSDGCYFRVPVNCATENLGSVLGYLAIENNSSEQVEICELQQG